MKKYYRIMLGDSSNFEESYKKCMIGIDFLSQVDLSNESDGEFSDDNSWRTFNKKYIPIYKQMTGNKSNTSSGLACAKLWTIRFNISKGDIILAPNRKGYYYIGEVISDYIYDINFTYPHFRKVKWLGKISRNIISNSLKNSMGATHALINITKFKDEVESLIESIKTIEKLEPEPLNKIDNTTERVLLYQITDKSLGLKKLNVYNDFNDMQLVYELVDCEEFTYIMFDRAHDTIKIGKTKNDPELRLAQLRTANPSIQLLHTFPSSLYSEKDLHNKFYDHLKDLEWYYYARGVRKFISDESEKHKKILDAYKKRSELDDLESDIFEILKLELEEI